VILTSAGKLLEQIIMRFKLPALLALLAMFVSGQEAEAQLTNSVYGFYWTAYPGAGCFATNVNGFANIGYLQWNQADADQIIACNSKLLPDTTWVFWDGANSLRADYQSVWNSYKAQFTPYYISQIAAFYVMDEPYLHGLTPSQLQTAVACIKADFPNIPVAVTFAYPSLTNFTSSTWIPSNLDWISFDQYGNFGAIAGLLSTIETYKQPHQKIFLTTQGWRSGDTDATVAGWSYDYHDLYLSDPEIFGQLSFLCRGAREQVFPSDGPMPLTYAVQQTIGTEVLKMGNSFKRAFSDMFESATLWTANWASMGAWARGTSPVRAGSYAARIFGSVTDSALTSKAIDVSNAKNASINFWWYAHGLVSGEYVRCDIAVDNGAWTQEASLDGGGASGDQWLHVIASDIDVSGATNLYLRFRGKMSAGKYAAVDSVNVCKWADPTVTTWPTATVIAPGQTLASSTLNGGSATPAGSFSWAVPLTVPPTGISTQSVIFTPADTASYNRIRGSVVVTVGTPTVSMWPTATAITYGQMLVSSTLSGGSGKVAGSFSWTAPSTVPNPGTSQQSVTYTPTDTIHYSPATSTVPVTTIALNLVLNGDFTENAAAFVGNNGIVGSPNPATITSWVTGLGNVGVNGPATGVGTPYAPPSPGSYNFAFTSWGGPSSGLSQTLSGNYTPGTRYELNFDAAQFRWAPSKAFRASIVDNDQTHFTTQVGGVDLDSTALTAFTHFKYVFVSPAAFHGPCVLKLMNLDSVTAVAGVDFANVTLWAFPATLYVARSGPDVQLIWPSGTLLEADTITGPWTTNHATSPYLLAPAGDKKFFRVRAPY
jgi:hypothetical protein